MQSLMVEIHESAASAEQIARIQKLEDLAGSEFDNELDFFDKVYDTVGPETFQAYRDVIMRHSITINSILVLIGLIMFVASFAISMGPVMWALLSEIFPNKLRGLAISIVGFWNSIVSFSVATLFPVQLELLGSTATYLIYSIFGLLSLIFVWRFVPETKGKSLEELEKELTSKS